MNMVFGVLNVLFCFYVVSGVSWLLLILILSSVFCLYALK